MKTYDFIFAGGGLAGLSLACRIARSPLRGRSILIVDQDAKQRDDRTFSFWSQERGPFSRAIAHSWDRLAFHAPGLNRVAPLGTYRYHTIRGIDFYRLARQELASCPQIEFIQGRVSRLQDAPGGAALTVDGQEYLGKWAFDSRPRLVDLTSDSERYHYLKLAFLGWEVETDQGVFDPRTPILMDFRTPQQDDLRFFYVLPFSANRALVEYTLFTGQPVSPEAGQAALAGYLRRNFGLTIGEDSGLPGATRREGGSLLVTDQPFPRRLGQHVLAIGLRGGRLKPSTGYAFTRIQRDSQAIVESLLRSGHPFGILGDSPLYAQLDAIMLEVMARHPGRVPAIFSAMFRKNPPERILRFLDEDASRGEIGQVIATLPPGLFLQVLSRRRISPYSFLRTLIGS